MTGFLLYIKDNFKLIWSFIEWLNALLFKYLYFSQTQNALIQSINENSDGNYFIRQLNSSDCDLVIKLVQNQETDQLIFFEPHAFDAKTIKSLMRNPSFYMMGVFFNNQLVGYFFLRCFINKACFVGRLVDKNHRGKGIGKAMNEILYNTAWGAGFRCFATISKNNKLVMKAHTSNDRMVIRKELANEHILVEFVKDI